MLTIFTAPRAFVNGDLFAITQRNAILSWTKLTPRPDVFLVGNDPGIEVFARGASVGHLPDVETVRDEEVGSDVPYVASTFAAAEAATANDWMCRINADIILMDDFMAAFQMARARFDRFLMVGRRYEVKIEELLDFGEGWQEQLRARAREHGKPGKRTGMDYFVYPRGLYPPEVFPRFIQARQGCDGWLLWYANMVAKIPTIEASDAIMAVHQNHPRTMLYGRREVMVNRALAGDRTHRLWNCTYSLTAGGQIRKGTRPQ